MTIAIAEELDVGTVELHEQPDPIDVAEADAEPGAKQPTYRIICDGTGDALEYEPLTTVPLTSLKQARARLKRVEGRCNSGDHWIEKLNGLGLWERYIGRKVGGVNVSERGLEITIPANPDAPTPRWRTDGVALTVTDFFAGCGGSSTGYERVPGLQVVQAINHWALAIASHQHNLEHADHDQADISKVDPRRYRTTDIGHFSPECTNWSQAKGKKIDFDTEFMQLTTDNLHDPDSSDLDPDAPEDADAKWRSRMLMSDVVRMTMHHRYKAIIVENVTDILAWWALPKWAQTIRNIGDGYHGKRLVLNSAFANQMGFGPPQLRDRVYFVFWQKKYRRPNFSKWLRPKCWCDYCTEIVEGIYSPLPGKPRAMRHGQQYHYTCPNARCKRVVQPFALPAKTAIDPSLPAQRIADRKTPLKPNTYNRVDAGLERWGPYLLAGMAGHTFERRPGVRTWPIGQPSPAQTATNTLGLVQPVGGSWNTSAHPTSVPLRSQTATESQAIVVPVEGRTGVNARPDDMPMRAQTARLQDAVVQPVQGTLFDGTGEALVVPLRNNGRAAPDGLAPLPAIVSGGTHHALVMRNNTARGDAGQMTTPDSEPGRALTTAGHQSVVQLDIEGLFSYRNGGTIGRLADPMSTQTTIEGAALLGGAGSWPRLRPEDCTLRMLAVAEIRAGMGFAPWFRLLGRAKRDLVKQLVNAVTPNVTAVLGALVFEAITGVELEPFDFDPFAPLW